MKQVVIKTALKNKPRCNDFEIKQSDVPICRDGAMLVRVAYLSLEPYIGSILRGRHFSSNPPKPCLEAVPGSVVAQVVESHASNFQTGDWIYAINGRWEEYSVFPEESVIKLDKNIAPMRAYASVLGIPGLTSWASATKLAKVKQGDVVLVNAAAGAVGGVFGQLAKLKGAENVIGIAGGPTKCSLVTDTYGFDSCIDYKDASWQEELKRVADNNVSVFHENVSAEMAMTALSVSQPYVRGVLCGLANAYQSDVQQTHPLNAGFVIMKRAQLMGLVVYDFLPRFQEFISEMAPLVKGGDIKIKEDVAFGLEEAPNLFEKLMNGENIGKTLVDLNGK